MQTATRATPRSPAILCAFRSVHTCAFSTSVAASHPIRRRGRHSSKYKAPNDRFAGDEEHSLDSDRFARRRPANFSRTSRGDDFFTFRPSKHNEYDPDGQLDRRFKQPWSRNQKDGPTDPISLALVRLGKNVHHDPVLAKLKLDSRTLEEKYKEYWGHIHKLRRTGDTSDALLKELNSAAKSFQHGSLDAAVRRGFIRMAIMATMDKTDLAEQQRVANLAYPSEWFPATRGMQREFHLHVGPTNSGKTYHALKRLEEAESGVYAGPLRLLAHEVYLRLNARGQRCNLITGDDRRTADDNPDAPMVSCTVEMVPLNWRVEVAVIDEIQMLGSEDRGWAWTQAVLGIQAREMHVCGEERVIPIMQELAALCGDKLHIHRYQRLSPLEMMPKSLGGDMTQLKKGDCVVCFSVVLIHALRQLIEKTLGVKVAVIYGSLPPETRAQQAQLFNDPDNDYDILVASDAVGMGLNLSINRIIFHASSKILGKERRILKNHEIKQIAGRAGRFTTAQQDMAKSTSQVDLDNNTPATTLSPTSAQGGFVTTLERFDYLRIARGMSLENDPITTAGIFPPSSVIERFASLFPPGTPFSFLLLRLNELAKTTSRFHLCDVGPNMRIADAIEPVENLRISDKIMFCSSPSEPRKAGEAKLICAYAELVAENRSATILDIPELDLDLLDDDYEITRDYLGNIEALHKGVVLWLWLSYRYETIFLNRDLSIHVKELVEKRIEDMLAKLAFDYDHINMEREQAVRDDFNSDEKHEDDESKVELSSDSIVVESEEQQDKRIRDVIRLSRDNRGQVDKLPVEAGP